MHRFDQCLKGIEHDNDIFLPLLKANLTALVSLTWLPPSVVDTVKSVIFARDDKPYWRTDWLLQPENYLRVERLKRGQKQLELTRQKLYTSFLENGELSESEAMLAEHSKLPIHYKAGRALPAYRFQKIKKHVFKWLEDGTVQVPFMGFNTYEADDTAASVVALNTLKGNPFNIVLLTVDADWLQLVNPNVTWVCMNGYAPAIRDK